MRLDPVEIDAKHHKVAFENEKVRVLRVSFGSREKAPMHSHPSGLIVYLSDHHTKHTDADGALEEMQAKPGSVQWIDPTDHQPENLSSQLMELILVELKP